MVSVLALTGRVVEGPRSCECTLLSQRFAPSRSRYPLRRSVGRCRSLRANRYLFDWVAGWPVPGRAIQRNAMVPDVTLPRCQRKPSTPSTLTSEVSLPGGARARDATLRGHLCALGAVAAPAQRLEVVRLAETALGHRHDVIDFKEQIRLDSD